MASKKKTNNLLNLLILGVTALMVLSCMAGYQLGKKEPQSSAPTETTAPGEENRQRLMLAVQVDYDTGIVSVPLAGRADKVSISNLSDVQITLPEGTMPLCVALEKGAVTPEELVAWAKLDAIAGICKETFQSENGLAYWLYSYSNVELSVYDDILEAPDGEHYPIRNLTLRDPGGKTTGVTMRVEQAGLLVDLSREDWGLSFEVTRADENGLTLTCTQSGGQLVGQAAIYSYMVSKLRYEGQDKIPVSWDGADSSQWMMIQNDGTTELRLEWKAPIPSGDYGLHLLIRDIYDPEDVHALIRNFEDNQNHSVQFTIP